MDAVVSVEFQALAARPGFEPGSGDPKSPVLPLHHRAIRPRFWKPGGMPQNNFILSQRLCCRQKASHLRTPAQPRTLLINQPNVRPAQLDFKCARPVLIVNGLLTPSLKHIYYQNICTEPHLIFRGIIGMLSQNQPGIRRGVQLAGESKNMCRGWTGWLCYRC